MSQACMPEGEEGAHFEGVMATRDGYPKRNGTPLSSATRLISP